MRRVRWLEPLESEARTTPNFCTEVYRLVAQIPPGKIATYGQIAALLGHPSAARAVGYALHALPTGSNIPWQRVINATGRISSRCNRHYEAIQRALLEAEGVRFDATGCVNLRTFRWPGPSPDESDHGKEADQHQGADQQQQDGDVQLQRACVQTTSDHRTKLPTQDDTRARKEDRAQ